jgi:hypothetical protein
VEFEKKSSGSHIRSGFSFIIHGAIGALTESGSVAKSTRRHESSSELDVDASGRLPRSETTRGDRAFWFDEIDKEFDVWKKSASNDRPSRAPQGDTLTGESIAKRP